MKPLDRVVVIGGGSGMGLEIARQALACGAEVVIAGRSQERLQAARTRLGNTGVEIAPVDIGDRLSVAALFARVAQFDHLVVTAANLPYGPVLELTESDLMRAIRSKRGVHLHGRTAAHRANRPGGGYCRGGGLSDQ